MHGSWQRLFVAASLSLMLSACNSTPKCVGDDEYLQAVERQPLRLPANVSASERMAPVVIPAVGPDPEQLTPAPECLDQPPAYNPRRQAAASEAASPDAG